MRALSAQLSAAAAAQDWTALEQAAHALPAQLHAWAGAGALDGAETAALAQLRAAHDHALAACARAGRAAADRLDEMHRNKEGWMAYGLQGAELPAGGKG